MLAAVKGKGIDFIFMQNNCFVRILSFLKLNLWQIVALCIIKIDYEL